MKVHRATIRLAIDGSPEFIFEVEPETDLERDAMKAVDFKIQMHRMDNKKDHMVATPEVFDTSDQPKGFWGARIWTSWQISPEAFHKRESERR